MTTAESGVEARSPHIRAVRPSKIAFNALSANHLSGTYVLLGHIESVLAARVESLSTCVIVHAANRSRFAHLAKMGCQVLTAPAYTSTSARRFAWELLGLKSLLARENVDLLFQPSGYAVPGLKIPQLVLAQNPYPMMTDLHRSVAERFANRVLRYLYGRTNETAHTIFANSRYMLRAYEALGSPMRAATRILYQGVFRGTWESSNATPAARKGFAERSKSIVSVSVVSRYKRFEDIIRAFKIVHEADSATRLTIIGPLNEPDYAAHLRDLAHELGVGEQVSFTGFSPTEELNRRLSDARVYCSLSPCESFGIPAVQAQLFGTPAVVGDCCAPPEIIGDGGAAVPMGDIDGVARKLSLFINVQDEWERVSKLATANASRFEWAACSEPLVKEIEQIMAERSS